MCLPLLLAALCCLGRAVRADDKLPGGGQATPVESITLPAGFRVQLLRSAHENEDSWISMTIDDRGRVIVGRDQRGVARMTLSEDHGVVEQFEVLEDTFHHCRGVLYAHDSLYVVATDSKGFYRLRDTDGDDRFDDVQLLKPLDYVSRYGHGPNQIVLGPDKMLYLVNGNDVALPEGSAADSPYRDPQDDHLLPEPRDAVDEVRVGCVLRTDPDGKEWEVLAGGFRNPFDVAFNSDGEMFTYDADMEWDVGLPWYRPTRLNHVVSGGEYGWRWGTGKWPAYFADSLPSTLDTGLGSPTGLEFGTRSNFPQPYRELLFMGEWQNGRILQVNLSPKGASYDADYEVFLEGGALNVCDLTFGPDGAMYFITGGRRSQSGLYRVTYEGPKTAVDPPGEEAIHLDDRTRIVDSTPADSTPADSTPAAQSSRDASERPARPILADGDSAAEAAAARRLRHRIEEFHRRRDPAAIDVAWPHLSSHDRWLRFAARLAVERQEPALWRERALSETAPTASIAALLALARLGRAEDQSDLLAALDRLPLEQLDREQLLDALRVWSLSFIRQGRVSDSDRAKVLARLDPLYPHASTSVNRELGRLLIYLEAPRIVPRTVDQIAAAVSQEDAIFFMQLLARVSAGWTDQTRETFFEGLLAARSYQGGKLLPDALLHIREDAVATLTDAQKERLGSRLERLNAADEAVVEAPPAALVKEWSWDELAEALPQADHGRSWEQGRAALAKASCIRCHRVGEVGTFTGPDLTRVGRRFDERALLESILRPAAVIDEKYRLMTYLLRDGEVITGRPVAVGADTIRLQTDLLRSESIEVLREQIEESYPATTSPMPSGLANVLTRDEILDLIAYLKTGGDPQAAAYQ